MIKLGVDVGGTFTDLVVIDEQTKKINLTKVPSTPKSPDQGVINGLHKVRDIFGADPAKIDFLIHGTTVATNALIERKGVKAALIVTQGFRDVLHIARQTRPKLYDFFERRPDPLINRHLRFEVPERVLYTGQVAQPLDEEAVRLVAQEIVVAVCLLHSYANPAHEQRVREIVEEAAPGVKVSISSEVLPEFKEFERMNTTVINAYVMPIVERYLQQIMASLANLGAETGLNIMQSNGGLMTPETAGKKSVHTVLSGPAAGVLGGLELAKMVGLNNIITIDMGGTSFDVSLAFKGQPSFTMESDIGGHIIKIPMIDIKTLGAGGGSIAWVDPGGALQVGPESAGADPGPACYGRGGQEPTVTDANLALGYLNPEYFAGGEMGLNVDLAREAINKKVAQPMGLGLEEAAEGILRVVNATMIRGIRLVSVQKGYDPREFALVCFGGAGPVHAVKLAKELNIPRLMVPQGPGVNCALGLLMADFRHDYSQTFLRLASGLEPGQLTEEFGNLEAKATAQMTEEGLAEKDIVFFRSADMRYKGQGYELEVGLPNKDYQAPDLEAACQDLGRIHADNYGYAMDPETAEFVNLRLTAIGLLSKPEIKEETPAQPDSSPALKGRRRVYMDGRFMEVGVLERGRLKSGNQIQGPAIVEQPDSTTVLFPGSRAEVDKYRNLIISVEGE
ncbi:MAG: hydantoinase/oxoprolinase family protein [Deltaproteobacteria bacterium]|nr:hydantoinase/oxoprolinase family protein [Deltaproteobacteria bacterium]